MTSPRASSVGVMSEAADNAIEQLEDQLEGAARTLSALSSLTDQQAQRVAQRPRVDLRVARSHCRRLRS